MANNIPTQLRTIDPYSSYNSNCVNALTRMVTRGTNCLHGTHSIDVVWDSISATEITILPGLAYKDDVIIQITEDFLVDMHDEDFYVSSNHFDEAGYYYILLNYTYLKSKPAPEASILILRPSEKNVFNSSHLFLKCVKVIWNGSIFKIDSIYDWDPDNINIRREYVQTYFGVEDSLPEFNQFRDEGRVIYIRNEDGVYYGGKNSWIGSDVVKDSLDTTGCPKGSLIYLTSGSSAALAIATARETFATGVVLEEGLISNGTGKIRLFGRADNVPVEVGRTTTTGDRLYLSNLNPGYITPIPPLPHTQFVGICLDFDVIKQTCSMWFMPSSSGGIGGGGLTESSIYADLLSSSIFKNLTFDNFINDDFIDIENTTAVFDYVNNRINGSNGKIFITKNLAESGSELINACQVSASIQNSGNITWYVSNHGNINVEYEPINLDCLHNFSELYLPIGSITGGSFIIGEIIIGSVSLNTAIVCGVTSGTCILVRNIIGNGYFAPGETLTGSISGATCAVNGPQVNRKTSLYNTLHIKAVFSGDGIIYDYGIIYKDDLDIIGYAPGEVGWGSFANLNTTPSIHGYKYWKTTSAGSSFNIVNFNQGFHGKEITIMFTSNRVTIKNNQNIKLKSQTDFTGSLYDTLTLVYLRDLNIWVEKSRSINSL